MVQQLDNGQSEAITTQTQMTTHNNFELGKRYPRYDGQIVEIVSRWTYRISKNGDVGAIVTGDDGLDRWDDPEPGIGWYTSGDGNSPLNLYPNVIPAGRTTTGPLIIR